jgi:hypothetical protein
MELAGLEPAISRVRFRRKPLQRFALLCRASQPCRAWSHHRAARAIATIASL